MDIPTVTAEMFRESMDAGDVGFCEGDCNIQKMADHLNGLLRAAVASDAKTTPGGNKTLPRCEVPDCVNQASFIINERPLCYAHAHRNPLPPSLREKE